MFAGSTGDTMKHAAEAAAPNPFDVRALWDVNNGVAAYGGAAMRAWMDSATRLQADTTAFWTGRVSKDVAAMTALARCTTPAEVMDAQMTYARDAAADFYAEGQRMMRIVNDAAKLGMPGAAAKAE
jgi:hypothetical protein